MAASPEILLQHVRRLVLDASEPAPNTVLLGRFIGGPRLTREATGGPAVLVQAIDQVWILSQGCRSIEFPYNPVKAGEGPGALNGSVS